MGICKQIKHFITIRSRLSSGHLNCRTKRIVKNRRRFVEEEEPLFQVSIGIKNTQPGCWFCGKKYIVDVSIK